LCAFTSQSPQTLDTTTRIKPNLKTRKKTSRAELEERCRFFLGADAIAEAEGIDVEAAGVDEEVARAKAQFKDQALGEFNEDAYRCVFTGFFKRVL
jgi:hypothetical protein